MPKKQNEATEDFDLNFGIGKLGIGTILNGIGNLVDLAAKLQESGGEIKEEGEINLDHLKKGMKGVFGFSVKTAASGKAVVEPFGNIKKTAKGPKVDEQREPIIDIFNEKDEMRVYAEMPGVNEQDIKLDLNEDILELSAQSGERKYYKEILLPAKAKSETLKSNYKNGILEIKLRKC